MFNVRLIRLVGIGQIHQQDKMRNNLEQPDDLIRVVIVFGEDAGA